MDKGIFPGFKVLFLIKSSGGFLLTGTADGRCIATSVSLFWAIFTCWMIQYSLGCVLARVQRAGRPSGGTHVSDHAFVHVRVGHVAMCEQKVLSFFFLDGHIGGSDTAAVLDDLDQRRHRRMHHLDPMDDGVAGERPRRQGQSALSRFGR